MTRAHVLLREDGAEVSLPAANRGQLQKRESLLHNSFRVGRNRKPAVKPLPHSDARDTTDGGKLVRCHQCSTEEAFKCFAFHRQFSRHSLTAIKMVMLLGEPRAKV